LIELIRAMENDRILKLSLQESYQYILCDEHQDSNAAQNRILELLADFHQSPNLFIVGDDKQAIYRFQGASLENFLYFRKKYRGTRVIDLEDNYRSHQGILDAAHSLIEHNPSVPGQSRVRLKSLHAGAKPIRAAEFNKTDDELLYIASAIGRLVERGEKGEEIAVIYRVNREAAGIALVLRAHGISHRIESDHDILGDIDSAKIIILSRAIFDLSDSEYLGRALFLPEMKCDSADVAMLSAAAKRLEKPLHTVIKESRKSAGDLKIKAAYDRLNEWSRQARLVPFPIFLNALIQETDMLAFIAAAADPLDRLDSLQALFEAVTRAAQARKSFYLSDFLEYVDVMKIHGIMAKRNYVEHAGGVRLMTAHGAKGLEFDHVFIVNAVDGVWGNRHRRNHFTIPAIEHARDVGRIEDERRLFYVAMTRARKSLMLCYALSDGKKETLPSQFISEIDPPLVSLLKPVSPDRQRALIRRVESLPKDPAASILDPQFVRSKFLSQPLSVTHLNNFLKCPWRYFFVNLIRVPQAQTKHQMYGTAVHAALRVFFDAYREERYLSKKQLGQIFRHHLEKQAMSVADRAESLEKGKRALEGYYATYVGNWNRQLITEYALKGAFVELDAPATARLELAGKLDKIEFIDGRDAAVVDYKTSRPRSRNEIEGRTRGADGDYKRQLVFYQLLSAVEKRFVMRYGEIDFVEPNERAIYKKERFVITAAEVSQLIETVKKMAAEVVTLSFISAGCGEKDCDHCRLGKILISDQRTE
ncbi:MAG: ATP-dependent helicase UvrD/PcrA, partial [Candidatus Parcubacteria bacterium]|nr:ATP-dependent helicase UvrD/PcrA [Candidatus Parcubacteria bacterium]